MSRRSASALHVTLLGEGEPLLLVHGSLSGDPARKDWPAQTPLAERYQLRMVARRGYFLSPDRPRGYDFDAEAEELADLLDGGTHVLGFSYGAIVALLAAARRPDAVWSLTLIEPPAFSAAADDPDVAAMVARLGPVIASAAQVSAEEYLRAFRRALRGLPADAPLQLTEDERQQLADPLLRRGIEAAQQEVAPWTAPLSSVPEGIRCPVLLVSGGWSRAFDAVADALEQRLTAERAVISGAGHGAQLMGDPFNQRLRVFLQAARP